MNDATEILNAAARGDPQAAEQLLPLVYDELRKLAAARLAQEKPGQTLQATALVHEAYLRLVGSGVGSQESGVGMERSEVGGQRSELHSPTPDPRSPTPLSFSSRGHFFAAAAEAMRRILIDQARRREATKRGGGLNRHDVDEVQIAAPEPAVDLLALDEALTRFQAADPQKADLVRLRYFAGLTIPEAAEVLGISTTTADRHWAYARAWLHAELSRDR